MSLQKPTITIAGVPLAATSGITWSFVTGTAPFQTVMTAHKSDWDRRLKQNKGTPQVLSIKDSRGVTTTIKDVYILHESPSDSPNRVAFVVSDKRWRWQYKLIVRDYNTIRRTGDRTAKNTVPVEAQIVVDEFSYMRYSLQPDGRVWTARKAVEDVLQLLEPNSAGSQRSWRVDSWPITDSTGRSDAGEFTLQGVQLRDQGDAALARLLSFIPGADIYIDTEGTVVVFDAADLSAAESHFRNLPPTTWDGDYAAWVDRKAIRPNKVIVHYQREVEVLFRYEDDYRNVTRPPQSRSTPFIENVLPTVDVETKVREFNPESGKVTENTVPAGTWVPVAAWLEAMNETRPASSAPWTFETISMLWLEGELDGALGNKGTPTPEQINIALRVQALKAHFRQTFRINRRYMDRVRELLDVRAGLLHPVTGIRAPAAVWGEACMVPSGKLRMIRANDPNAYTYTNIFGLAANDAGTPIISCEPSPGRINIIDAELGVFSIEWIASPYGLTEAYVPCHLVEEGNPAQTTVVSRNLALQDTKPMGSGIKVEGGTNGIFLSPRMRFAAMMTIVPCAPNNKNQFHTVTVEAQEIDTVFQSEFRITDGDGPDLEVFVPPGELTARFAWQTDNIASRTIQDLLGLLQDDEPGIDGNVLPGYQLVNEQSHLTSHAKSLAAEMIANFADNVQGAVTTPCSPTVPPKIVGNMAGVQLRVSAAPAAKIDLVHQFPGQQKPISRLALLPESARQIILGTLPFGKT